MHSSVYEWVREVVTEHNLAGRSTIEIGSGIASHHTFMSGYSDEQLRHEYDLLMARESCIDPIPSHFRS